MSLAGLSKIAPGYKEPEKPPTIETHTLKARWPDGQYFNMTTHSLAEMVNTIFPLVAKQFNINTDDKTLKELGMMELNDTQKRLVIQAREAGMFALPIEMLDHYAIMRGQVEALSHLHKEINAKIDSPPPKGVEMDDGRGYVEPSEEWKAGYSFAMRSLSADFNGTINACDNNVNWLPMATFVFNPVPLREMDRDAAKPMYVDLWCVPSKLRPGDNRDPRGFYVRNCYYQEREKDFRSTADESFVDKGIIASGYTPIYWQYMAPPPLFMPEPVEQHPAEPGTFVGGFEGDVTAEEYEYDEYDSDMRW